ncbi:hypothetical protein J6590_027136 [Homalodisca vitripennis]|nr:hypothetical protein J6590_027136 [Homalodisca vitripennis]
MIGSTTRTLGAEESTPRAEEMYAHPQQGGWRRISCASASREEIRAKTYKEKSEEKGGRDVWLTGYYTDRQSGEKKTRWLEWEEIMISCISAGEREKHTCRLGLWPWPSSLLASDSVDT